MIDEAVRNGSLKKNPKKRGKNREPSRDRNVKDDNKRTRTGNAFAITTNPVNKEDNGTIPKCVSYNLHHPYEIPCWACFICGRSPGHMAKDCRVAPRMVNPVNARNLTAAPGSCYECGGTDHLTTCPRLNQAQRLGETVQTKLLLIMGNKIVGTMVTRHIEGRLCWEQRRLARTRTS
ncbi:hypothetical protein Tco_0192114 [Tanacetum coccineum]